MKMRQQVVNQQNLVVILCKSVSSVVLIVTLTPSIVNSVLNFVRELTFKPTIMLRLKLKCWVLRKRYKKFLYIETNTNNPLKPVLWSSIRIGGTVHRYVGKGCYYKIASEQGKARVTQLGRV